MVINDFKLFILIFILIAFFTENGNPINVDTKLGKICGRNQIINGKELNVFLGVPYAQPPLDNFRFMKPVPVEPWKCPIKAYNWPNPCVQGSKEFDRYINSNVSEDCLYLNVFAPKQMSNALLPVMIWIHGGGFIVGTSGQTFTIPTVLSTYANVIVVSINYRLNTFGFLYTDNDEAPGNVGMYDQIMALQWVKDNIDSFGGDPNRVTLFGQSAGSMSVDIHLLSPLSRHLFKNAIMMSGSSLSHLWVHDKEDLIKSWAKSSKIAGCGNGINITVKDIECLRDLNTKTLSDMIFYGKTLQITPMVAYGTELLPKSPFSMLKEGNFKRGVSLLSGNVNDEGSHWLLYIKPDVYNEQLQYREAIDQIVFVINNLNLLNPIDSDIIKNFYFNPIPKNNSNLLRRTLGMLFGDARLLCPTLEYSKLFFMHGNRVYQYYFTQKPYNVRLFGIKCPEWAGMCHDSDLLYWFGNPFIYRDKFTDDERRVSTVAMDVLSHFAYHGTPPQQNGIEWQNYYTINDKVIAPYFEFPSQQNPDGYFSVDLKHTECESFWDQYIYY